MVNGVLNTFTFDTVPEMHDWFCRRFFVGKLGEHYNWSGTSEVGMDNVGIGVQSFDFDVNLKELWLTRHRWNMMVRQYIDPDALANTLNMVEMYLGRGGKARRGIATMRMAAPTPTEGLDEEGVDLTTNVSEELRTKLVKSWNAGRQMSRRWGSCMLSLTYRNVPHPTVTLSSRTTYFGYLALMDITVAQVFGRMCGAIVGVNPADMRFVWNLNLAQSHGFRCLAWALSRPEYKEKLDKHVRDRSNIDRKVHAGFYKQLIGYRKVTSFDDAGVLYGDEKFASYSRVRRRFHTEVMGYEYGAQFEGGTHTTKTSRLAPLPDLWTSGLDFSALERRGKRE
jgi:hypothetical protein